jgi:vancomycin permeability regulator SanA
MLFKQIRRKIEELITKRFYINTKSVLRLLIIAFLLAIILPLSLHRLLAVEYADKIHLEEESVAPVRVAIVFGAGLENNATQPGDVLEDRVLTAVDLYKSGKVQKIIMSGDNRIVQYNEPQVMVDFAIENGVRDFDVQPDYAGRSTYETCYRAREIFGVSQAILVTQEYHLPRALYLCNSLGIDSEGVAADRQFYQHINNYKFREYLANVLAFWNLYVDRPEVVLGEKIEI